MQRNNTNKRLLDRLGMVSEIRSRNRLTFRTSLMQAAMNPGQPRPIQFQRPNDPSSPYQEGPRAA